MYLKFSKYLLILVILYSITRVLFFINYVDLYQQNTYIDILKSFIIGLRFDLSTLALIQSPFILLFYYNRTKIYKHFFLIINIGLWFINIGDIHYYKFTGTRVNFSIIYLINDIYTQLKQLVFNNPLSAFFPIIIYITLYKLYPVSNQIKHNQSSIKSFLKYIGAIILCVIFARGGFQVKPLTQTHAYSNQSDKLANLSLNSTFTFMKSYKNRDVARYSFFKHQESLDKALLNLNPKSQQIILNKIPNNKNIMLIILESFSYEYVFPTNNKSYTPFLRSLIKKSSSFKYAFANGRRSIDAIPALNLGLPELMDEPWITSNYQNTTFLALGKILQDNNYTTSFFHGGHNGTMYFDVLAHKLGLNNYYGFNEFINETGNKNADDKNWGIYDKPFLQYVVKQINKSKKPFFSTVFTLSSHNPYKIPKEDENKFSAGPLAIHKSISYADYALSAFFASAKKQDWFNNTIFIITADHTAENYEEKFNSVIGKYRIPILFYSPNYKLSLNTEKIIQQINIPKTIIDILQLEKTIPMKISCSIVANNTSESCPVLLKSGATIYALIKDKVVSYSTETLLFSSFNLNLESNSINKSEKEHIQLKNYLKASLQYYNNSLIKRHFN